MKLNRMLITAVIIALLAALAPPRAALAYQRTIYVSTAAQLKEIADATNREEDPEDYDNDTIVLTNDIDLSAYPNWEPIGARGYFITNHGYDHFIRGFSGTIDGNGHKITGLKITSLKARKDSAFYAGLVGCGGGVRNLTVEGDINVTGVRGTLIAGGIAGYGSAYDCISRVSVTASTALIYNDRATRYTGRTVYDSFRVSAGGVVGVGGAHGCVFERSVTATAPTYSYTYTGRGVTRTGYGGNTAFAGGIGAGGIVWSRCVYVTNSLYNGSGVSAYGLTAYAGGIAAMHPSDVRDCSVAQPDNIGASTIHDSKYAHAYTGVLAARCNASNACSVIDFSAPYDPTFGNAVVTTRTDLTVVGDGGRLANGKYGTLRGTTYYHAKSSVAELQPVIVKFTGLDGKKEIPYGEAFGKTPRELGVTLGRIYPENSSLATVGKAEEIVGAHSWYGTGQKWSYFKSAPEKIALTYSDAKTQINSMLDTFKISHITDAYKKDYKYAEPMFTASISRENGKNSHKQNWFSIYLKRYEPAPVPVPEPVPVVTPPAPGSQGWLTKSADLTTVDANTFSISSPNQLAGLAARSRTENFAGKTIILTKDIDLSGDKWMPIGDASIKFAGTFDGKDYTIKNMYCVESVGGLFEHVCTNGVVQNLHVEGLVSGDAVGGVAYINEGTIKETSFAGKMSAKNGNWRGAGGITYSNMGTIDKCTTNVEMTGSGTAQYDSYGGIAAFNNTDGENNEGLITGCTSNGTISPTGDGDGIFYVGGIVGCNDGGGSVKNSESRASITVGGACYPSVGGIAGQNGDQDISAGTVESCKSYGTVPAHGGKVTAGGIVGINNELATVKECGWLKGTADKACGDGKEAENTAAFESGSGGDIVVITGANTEESAQIVEPSVISTKEGVIAQTPTLLNLSFVTPEEITFSNEISLTTDANDNIIVSRDAIINNLPGNVVKSFDIVPLPLFLMDISVGPLSDDEFIVSPDITTLVTLETTLNAYADQDPSKIVLLKVLKDNDIKSFKWAKSAAEVGDGEFFIAADTKGTPISGNIVGETKYCVFIGIRDNGAFDLDPADGAVVDPAVLAMGDGSSPAPDPVNGGGGGCAAGCAVLALLAVPFVIRRKR